MRLVFSTVLFLVFTVSQAQTLTRRTFFGIQMNDNEKNPGVLVQKVLPGSTAEEAGIEPGDIITELGGEWPSEPNDILGIVSKFSTGQPIKITVLHGNDYIEKELVLKPLPEEKYPDFKVEYGAVVSGKNLCRTMVNRPAHPGKRPALLWLPGVNCYSLDSPFDTSIAELRVLSTLTRGGFLTMRVDRPATGDSRGTPCGFMSFSEELQLYRDALNALIARPDVDTSKIFLLGHSMGGVFAPMVAKGFPVRGIVAYGTIGRSLSEYLVESRRFQSEFAGQDLVETERYLKATTGFCGQYLEAKQPLQKVLLENPTYDTLGFGQMLGFRADTFWHELADVQIALNWQRFSGKALFLYGDFDLAAVESDHKLLAEVVNKARPENAEFKKLPYATHGMEFSPDKNDAKDYFKKRPYFKEVGKAILEWLLKQCAP